MAKPAAPAGGDAGQPGLAVAPQTLNFGPVASGRTRTLPIVVSNPGDRLLTLEDVAIVPKQAPFAVESLGYGPFWLRPGREREILVTFLPATTDAQTATLVITAEGLSQRVSLVGN